MSIQAFNKEALEQAESIAHNLTERAGQEKAEGISKKRIHNERLKQSSSASSKTMFHYFGAAKNEKKSQNQTLNQMLILTQTQMKLIIQMTIK